MANEGCITWTVITPESVVWSAVSPNSAAWTAISAYGAVWTLMPICTGYEDAMSKEIHYLGQKLNVYKFGQLPSQQTHYLGQKLVVSFGGGFLSQQTYIGSGTKIRIWRVL